MRPLLLLALLASLLTAGCTGSGGSNDDDADGVADATEETPRTITIRLLAGDVTRQVTSDPDKADTDEDGIPDGTELGFGIDPRDVDTDGDGLLDGVDLKLDPASDAAIALRARGILEEPPGTFLGELSRCPQFGGLKPNQESSDRPLPDRLADGAEREGWDVTLRGATRHVVSDPCLSDADSDGLLDHDERAAGSDPNLADSDEDGAPDGSDADPAADLTLLLRSLNATTHDGRTAILRFAAGAANVTLTSQRSAQLAVDDQTTTRGSLPLAVLVTATDEEGEPLALTPNAGGAVLFLDLLQGTAAVGDEPRRPLSRFAFEGEDGSLSFEWATLRR